MITTVVILSIVVAYLFIHIIVASVKARKLKNKVNKAIQDFEKTAVIVDDSKLKEKLGYYYCDVTQFVHVEGSIDKKIKELSDLIKKTQIENTTLDISQSIYRKNISDIVETQKLLLEYLELEKTTTPETTQLVPLKKKKK